MIAIILAAGYGTRLYPLTKDTPKALLPVKETPILGHLMEKLKDPQVQTERAVLVSNHKFTAPFQKWAAGVDYGFPCDVLDDGSTSDENRLGSVGDLAFAIRSGGLESKEILVLGSDNLFADSIASFMTFARAKGSITLGAYELPELKLASQYGVLSTDDQEKITAFTEKPAHPPSKLVSTAVYFFPSETVPLVLEYSSSKEAADTLGSFISWLISRKPVYAYRFKGTWFDIGDIASYKHAQETF